jgi:hypothetical protein
MPITEIDIQLIEKHLDKSLSNTEQAAFEERLADADFVSELALYKKSVHAIYASGDAKLKALLQLEEDKLATPQYVKALKPSSSTKSVKMVWWSLAATFLVGAFTFLFVLNRQPKHEKVFANHFKAYGDDQARRGGQDVQTDIDQAFLLYNQKKYAQSLVYFEKLRVPQYHSDFYQANAYLATNQIDKAIPLLEKISQGPTSEKQPIAEWYLALALLKTQPEKAMPLFEKMKSNPNHTFQREATAVWSEMQ